MHKDGDHEDMDAKLQAWDDVSGAALDPKEVRRARLKWIPEEEAEKLDMSRLGPCELKRKMRPENSNTLRCNGAAI